MLKFTPLEFETVLTTKCEYAKLKLKFTPLEFETSKDEDEIRAALR